MWRHFVLLQLFLKAVFRAAFAFITTAMSKNTLMKLTVNLTTNSDQID
jgi:hypothetical protein